MKKILHSKKTISAFTLVALMLANYVSFTNNNGPPTTYTNAPSESTCTSCHSGTAQSSGNTHSKIGLSFNTGSLEYIPDSTYTLSISVSHGSWNKFGFQTTILDKNNKFVGSFTAGSGNQKSTNAGLSRDYISHNSSGTAGSSNARTWSFSWKAPSSNVGALTCYMSVMCSNAASGNSGDSVFTKKFTIDPSSQLPTASISVNAKALCVDDTLFCTGGGSNNPTSWNWAVTPSANVSPASTSSQQNPYFIFTKAGTYKVKMSNANSKGKSAPDSVTITAFALPSISISAPVTTLCQGQSVTITASTAAGNSIDWSNGGSGDSITVNTAGTYVATALNANNCKATSNSITITVNPLPQVSLNQTTSGSSFCETDTVEFAATAGMSSYTFWVNGTAMQTGSADSYKLTGMAGTIDLQATADSNGCTSTASNTVQVSITARLNAPVGSCQSVTSSSITYGWNAVTGASGYEISEDGGTTWKAPSSGSTGTTHSLTGLSSGQSYSIKLRATGSNPCPTGKDTTLSCFTGNCATTTYTVNSNSTACEGGQDTITITPTNATNFSISFNGGTAGSSKQYVYTVANGANVIPVEIFDSAQLGCPTAKFNVTVNSYRPAAPALVANKTKVCMPKDAPVTFTATPAGADSYKFYDSLGNLLTTVSGGNTYQSSDETVLISLRTATQIDNRGCESPASSAVSLNVVTDPKLSIASTLLDAGYTYSFVQSHTGGFQAGWTFGDGGIAAGDSVGHKYNSNGQVVVAVSITKQGCQYKAYDTLQIVKVGMSPLTESGRVYPNPFGNELNIELSTPAQRLILMDAQGRIVIQLSENELNGKYFLTLATLPLPFGVYVLQTETNSGIQNRKLVKVSE